MSGSHALSGQGDSTHQNQVEKVTQGPSPQGAERLPQLGQQRQGQEHRLCLEGPKDGVGSSSFLPLFLSSFFFFFFNKRGDKGSCQEALSSKV